jgi:hypothetical protein
LGLRTGDADRARCKTVATDFFFVTDAAATVVAKLPPSVKTIELDSDLPSDGGSSILNPCAALISPPPPPLRPQLLQTDKDRSNPPAVPPPAIARRISAGVACVAASLAIARCCQRMQNPMPPDLPLQEAAGSRRERMRRVSLRSVPCSAINRW